MAAAVSMLFGIASLMQLISLIRMTEMLTWPRCCKNKGFDLALKKLSKQKSADQKEKMMIILSEMKIPRHKFLFLESKIQE